MKDTIIIYDDMEADAKTGPEHRKKVLEHYDEFVSALGVPKEMLWLEGSAAEVITKAVISLFRCGPHAGPCGPPTTTTNGTPRWSSPTALGG